MARLWVAALLLLASGAWAGVPLPQQLTVVYDLYRDGHKLGTVSDRFARDGTHYRLQSESRASGALALLWPVTIHLESRGVIGAQGLRPERFVHERSDRPEKSAVAELDWATHRVHFHYKGETVTEPGLRDGAQDQLSQLYQFAFLDTLPERLDFQVVSGRKFADYRYLRHDGGVQRVPAGSFSTQRFERVMDAGAEKAVTVWIAAEPYRIPVRIRVIEEGVTMEQRLVRFDPGP
jgi:hypothetical protein